MSTISPVAAGTTPAAASTQGFSTKCADAAKSAIKMVGELFSLIGTFAKNNKVATGIILTAAVLLVAAYFLAPSDSDENAGTDTVRAGRTAAPAKRNAQTDGSSARSSAAAGAADDDDTAGPSAASAAASSIADAKR